MDRGFRGGTVGHRRISFFIYYDGLLLPLADTIITTITTITVIVSVFVATS